MILNKTFIIFSCLGKDILIQILWGGKKVLILKLKVQFSKIVLSKISLIKTIIMFAWENDNKVDKWIG